MTEAPSRPTLIVVSGMSGSGKSVALATLEDMDFYCVDNLPAELLPDFVRTVTSAEEVPEKLAVGIDIRNRNSDLSQIPEWLSAVGALGLDPQLVFFDTDDAMLLRRYADTRRRHPLSHLGLVLADAISLERQVLKPLQRIADAVIDTSGLNVHQLRRQVITGFGLGDDQSLSLLFESFAYRRGVPPGADFVFDARVLPNPHWNPELRPLSGRDLPVREHLDREPDVIAYAGQVASFLDTWLPRMGSDNRSYVTIAFGCTGGRHRSVYLAESMARHFRDAGRDAVAAVGAETQHRSGGPSCDDPAHRPWVTSGGYQESPPGNAGQRCLSSGVVAEQASHTARGTPASAISPSTSSSPNIARTSRRLSGAATCTETRPDCTTITWSGGEIRDEGATGRGSKPKAGLTGFTVSNLRIPGFEQPWEADGIGAPSRGLVPLAKAPGTYVHQR